jgi:hypothetical protein
LWTRQRIPIRTAPACRGRPPARAQPQAPAAARRRVCLGPVCVSSPGESLPMVVAAQRRDFTFFTYLCVPCARVSRGLGSRDSPLDPKGVEADDRGRWAVRGIMAVRRHEGRRGRPLDVLVEWEGEDSDGDLWEESWVSVTELTPDLRAEARQLEIELFGPRRTTAAEARRRADAPASRRADRRATAAQRQERERDAQQWRARLRDRAPTPAGTAPSSGEDR